VYHREAGHSGLLWKSKLDVASPVFKGYTPVGNRCHTDWKPVPHRLETGATPVGNRCHTGWKPVPHWLETGATVVGNLCRTGWKPVPQFGRGSGRQS